MFVPGSPAGTEHPDRTIIQKRNIAPMTITEGLNIGITDSFGDYYLRFVTL